MISFAERLLRHFIFRRRIRAPPHDGQKVALVFFLFSSAYVFTHNRRHGRFGRRHIHERRTDKKKNPTLICPRVVYYRYDAQRVDLMKKLGRSRIVLYRGYYNNILCAQTHSFRCRDRFRPAVASRKRQNTIRHFGGRCQVFFSF